MVERRRQRHHRAHRDLAVQRDGALLDRPDCDDRGLGRVEHCRELLDPEHAEVRDRERDRKSTRLNSSHGSISYAVFCLKKKKKIKHISYIYKKKITTN